MRGTISGGGQSCWHTHVIPFTLRGEYDLTKRTAMLTKQHTDVKFSNALNYTVTLSAEENAPTHAFELTSKDPNLSLRPVTRRLLPLEDIPEAEACKVCMDRVINCVLLPCGHMCVCKKCTVQLALCPMCRASVKDAPLVFRS